jgi:signal transduction histidine kinase
MADERSDIQEAPGEATAAIEAPGLPRPLKLRTSRRVGGFLWGMRVRKKVLFLHTLFFLGLAAVLLIPLRPAITDVVEQAEVSEARMILRLAMSQAAVLNGTTPAAESLGESQIRHGSADELGLDATTANLARASPGRAVGALIRGETPGAVAFVPGGADGQFWLAAVRIPESRRAVLQLYLLTAVALLAVYALVAAALELFVLPQHVYGPISRMLDADLAVQEGNKDQEIISDAMIPADELGEIMRSRNRTVLALRSHEAALADALAELERVANDLKRKNHLLEAARRNLADADRLASLGMMSAGIAHELNTPLAVVKGLAEKLNADPEKRLDPAQAALMVRVVRRLERLGESLLDFARVRSPETQPAQVRTIVEEAATLVRLDRDRGGPPVEIVNAVPDAMLVECDADRMVQVLVNLLRNSCDAIRSAAGATSGSGDSDHRVTVSAEVSEKDGQDWVSISVTDDGPGIDPDLISRLFEPFASTRLDAHGTGLGLAVAEGIVREHGGLILARNRSNTTGATFEIMLPVKAVPHAAAAPSTPPPHTTPEPAAS